MSAVGGVSRPTGGAYLTVSGLAQLWHVPPGGALTIGTARGVDIRLPASGIHRQHLLVCVAENSWKTSVERIADRANFQVHRLVDSALTVYYGYQWPQCELRDGDVIHLGLDQEIVVQIPWLRNAPHVPRGTRLDVSGVATPLPDSMATAIKPMRSLAEMHKGVDDCLFMHPMYMPMPQAIATDRIHCIEPDNFAGPARLENLLRAATAWPVNYVLTIGRETNRPVLWVGPKTWEGQAMKEAGTKHAQIAFCARPKDGLALYAGELQAHFDARGQLTKLIANGNSGEFGKRADTHSGADRQRALLELLQIIFPRLREGQIHFQSL